MEPNPINPSNVEAPKPARVSTSDAGANSAPQVGWSIDKGVTRENNEDSLAAVTVSQASEADAQSVGVYAVADGIGGQDSGEVASKLAVRTAIRKLMENITESNDDMPDNYRQWLEMAVTLANQVVHEKADVEKKKMGTTLVLAVVVGNDVHVANVGNSRAYLISPTDIRQITHDQSMTQTMVDNGLIKPEDAATHPYRKILTQSVGSHDAITVDSFTETLQEDEALLLCSDGLWNMLGDAEIMRIVRTVDSPTAACQALVDACNQKNARDDIAAVLVRQGLISH